MFEVVGRWTCDAEILQWVVKMVAWVCEKYRSQQHTLSNRVHAHHLGNSATHSARRKPSTQPQPLINTEQFAEMRLLGRFFSFIGRRFTYTDGDSVSNADTIISRLGEEMEVSVTPRSLHYSGIKHIKDSPYRVGEMRRTAQRKAG